MLYYVYSLVVHREPAEIAATPIVVQKLPFRDARSEATCNSYTYCTFCSPTHECLVAYNVILDITYK